MITGMTGTQRGMTEPQKRLFALLIADAEQLHHGLCIGSDENAHVITREVNPTCRIIGHPPIDKTKMAHVECDELRDPAPYLVRNRNITYEVEFLIATPGGFKEQLRSGTWSTVRYMRAAQKSLVIVFPNGDTWYE